MTDEQKKGVTLSVVNVLIGWILTFGTAAIYVGQKDASYSLRIQSIEREVESLDERLDTSEAFRASIVTDLAEIKTDLLWIRKTLEHGRD